MLHATYLIPVLPLVGFLCLAAFGRRIGEPASGILATAAVTGSFALAVADFVALLHSGPARSFTQSLWTWIPVGDLHVDLGFTVDPLSMTMVLFVTGISALIHLYSISYMKGDGDFPKFFLYMNLFVASMLVLVLGSNLLVTFVGWEGVGVCSYWLISYWFGRESAASAGKKAFIYNRVGDVGFLLAMFLTYETFHSLDYHTVFAAAGHASGARLTAIALLLFVGAAGKSAQFPLFPWLADAMEGPTPVSALIHAATMVTAGVYLMARINPILHLAGAASFTVAIVGAGTAFIAATIACAQDDIKKVLAYSTVSQLGYMFLAVGTGAYEAAIFLMVAHAFFKALLFLGAGSVIHGLHDEQDLKAMGNLRRMMKVTFWTFGIGWLAIAGIPPLSGFWAKGDVLDAAYARHPALWAVGLITAFLTAYYMSRLMGLAFFGGDRWREAVHGGEPHESPWPMKVPLIVLAVLAFAGGALSFPFHTHYELLKWVDPVFGANAFAAHESTGVQWALGTVDAVVALLGVAVAMALWTRSADRPALEPRALARSWYLDDVTDALIGRPGSRLAAFAGTVVEWKVIDGAVGAVSGAVRWSGGALRRAQTGYVRNYALWIVIGMVGIFGFMLTRVWWS